MHGYIKYLKYINNIPTQFFRYLLFCMTLYTFHVIISGIIDLKDPFTLIYILLRIVLLCIVTNIKQFYQHEKHIA